MSGHDLTVWGAESMRAMRVHWMLLEVGLDYEFHPVQSRSGETQTEAYTALNPKQKIPMLRHGDLLLTESAAIVAYLADAFETPAGFHNPKDPAGRAKVAEWSYFVMMELDAHTLYVIRRHVGLKEIYGEAPNAVQAARDYFLKQLNAVSPGIDAAGAYLFGDGFSTTDILLMSCLDWARYVDIELPAPLAAYQRRVGERPAYRQAFARNFAKRTIDEVR